MLFAFTSCNSDLNKPKEEKFAKLCSCMDEAFQIEEFNRFDEECQSCFDNIEWRDRKEFEEAHVYLIKNCPKSIFRREETKYFQKYDLDVDMFEKVSEIDCRKYFGGKWSALGAENGSYTIQLGKDSKSYHRGKLVVESRMLSHKGCTGTFKVIKNHDKTTFFQFEEGMIYEIETIGIYDTLVLSKFHLDNYFMYQVGYKLKD